MTEKISRRSLLRFVAGAPLFLPGILRQTAGCADAKEVAVVDTHIHCFAGPNEPRFPYHARAPYQPEAPATPEDLLKCMGGAGVKYAVIVHPEPYQDDHRYLEHCLHVGRSRFKGTCLVFADQAESMKQLAGLVKRCPVAAVRIHAYAPERLPPFGKPPLRELWKQAAELGLMVQLHFEPRYAPGFEPLIKEFADTTVIIDHLGRPFQGTPEEHAVVVRWSRFPNTVMKLAAIPSPKEYPHRDIGPTMKKLVDAYGPDRLIAGGGFGPGSTAESYRAAIEHTRSYLASLSKDDQAKVMGGTAVRVFRFEG